MALLDHQLGLSTNEVTYGTPVTPVTRFSEYNSEGIEETEGRTEGDPLRSATLVKRDDRFTPYFAGAAGPIQLDVMSKGFGYWLQHMLGAVATTGPAETAVFTHTGTMGETFGKSFTCQVNRPFTPSGTNQALTYSGGKVNEWTISNTVDGNLVLELGTDFAAVSDAIALASAVYPTSMDNLTWAGGSVTIGGSAYDLTEISVKGSNNLNTDRRQIRGNTQKKEPTSGRREVEFSLSADFESLTQRNRAHATTRAAALAQIVATWVGPTIIAGATTLKPQVTLTIPSARFDKWAAPASGPDAITQTLSGAVRYNGTNSPVTIAYQTADTTP